MRRLATIFASALCLGGITAAGSNVAAAPLGPFAAIADEVVPAEDLLDELDWFAQDLEWLERDLGAGFFGQPRPEDFGRIDELWSRVDDMRTRVGKVTYGELDAMYADLDDLMFELSDRIGDRPFPDDLGRLPIDDGAASPGEVAPIDPAMDALAAQTAALVFTEAQILLALDAFDDDTTEFEMLVGFLTVDLVGDADRAQLLEMLATTDARAAQQLAALSTVTPPIGPATKQTVAKFLPTDLARISEGDGSPIGSVTYVRAIESLLLWSGRPGEIGGPRPAPEQLASELRGELMALEALPAATTAPPEEVELATNTTGTGTTTDTATDTPATDTAPDEVAARGTQSNAATPPPDPEDGGRVTPWLLVGAAALALVAGIGWLVIRRGRKHVAPGRPAFHELLDVSRRLASADSTEEVEAMAVHQAMRFCGAVAGAFIRHADRRLSIGYTSDAGLLVEDRLGDGVLDRVVGAGQELIQVSQTEPAIRNLPVSLIAVPIFARGAVAGTVVLVRGAEDPFDAHDLALLVNLKPIIGSAIESAQSAERAKAEALLDGLTGVQNRRSLDAAVAARGPSAEFAAIMVDLDHFKSVNDNYGHQAGDDLLRSVVRRISENVRPGDEVYRYGGEEFTIVMPETDEATAAEIAERVRVAIADRPFVIGPDAIRHSATASFGVAAGAGGETVFARADAALYEAKNGGRDRVMCAGVPA